MNYFIRRELQEYGPYSLAELQRYVASGNVLLTDECRSEGMIEWVPVSQVIGTIPVPMQAAAPAAPAPASQYPSPPNLHWGIAILLGVVTCGLFGWAWVLVQAAWVKKVQPTSKAMIYYAAALGLFAVSIVLSVNGETTKALGSLTNLAGAVFWIFGAFSVKSSIEEHYTTAEPIGLQLSGVMTFFFNIYYFQYHFTQINEMKNRQAGAIGFGT